MIGCLTADPVYDELMIRLTAFDRLTRQRACDAVRRPRKVAALNQQLLHMPDRAAAHPLLDEDMRCLGGHLHHQRRADRQCRSCGEAAAQRPPRNMTSMPEDMFHCKKEFSYPRHHNAPFVLLGCIHSLMSIQHIHFFQ